MKAAVFRAINGRAEHGTPEKLTAETDASCFYHPSNRAAKPCDECGRFLCKLCEIDAGASTLCPSCFQKNLAQRKQQDLETSRTMHDSIALGLATLPAFLLFWPVFLTGPVSIFWALRHWKSPSSIVPRTRVRFYLAILFGLAETAGIVAFVVALTMVNRR